MSLELIVVLILMLLAGVWFFPWQWLYQKRPAKLVTPRPGFTRNASTRRSDATRRHDDDGLVDLVTTAVVLDAVLSNDEPTPDRNCSVETERPAPAWSPPDTDSSSSDAGSSDGGCD